MIGLLLIAIVAIYIAFAIFVVTLAKQRRTRLILTLVMVVLPFVENNVGKARLRWLCDTRAGIATYSRVPAIESLETETGAARILFEQLPRLRQVVEANPDGGYYVVERDPGAGVRVRLEETSQAAFTAKYVVYRDWLNIQHVDISVLEQSSRKLISQGRHFSYHGDALVRLLSGGSGDPAPITECENSLTFLDVVKAATSDSNPQTIHGGVR